MHLDGTKAKEIERKRSEAGGGVIVEPVASVHRPGPAILHRASIGLGRDRIVPGAPRPRHRVATRPRESPCYPLAADVV